MQWTLPALALRPILDAIGLGAHRPSKIAARIGQPRRRQRGPDRYCAIYGLKYFASPMF